MCFRLAGVLDEEELNYSVVLCSLSQYLKRTEKTFSSQAFYGPYVHVKHLRLKYRILINGLNAKISALLKSA